MNRKSAAGLTMKIIVKIFPLIKLQLTKFFKGCLLDKMFPDEWKCSIVTPLYKNKGDKTDLNNYRGIYVLTPIAKLFEKCITS